MHETQTASGKRLNDAEAVGKMCTEVEAELAELKHSYEQFFLGIERKPPAREHDMLKKRMRDLKSQFIRQTALKFRVNSLAQRMATYERLWEKTLKEIESGTYKRDVYKARRHRKQKKPEAVVEEHLEEAQIEDAHVEEAQFEVDDDFEVQDLETEFGVVSAATPAPRAASSGSQPPTASSASKAVPTIPAVPAVAPAIKPVTGTTPAFAPPTIQPMISKTPAPISGSTSGPMAQFTPPSIKAVPAVAKPTTGSTPAFSPPGIKPLGDGQAPVTDKHVAYVPSGKSGVASTPTSDSAVTGAHNAFVPSIKPVTGAQAVVAKTTGAQVAQTPSSSAKTGAHTAFTPKTGSQPALNKPGVSNTGSVPVMTPGAMQAAKRAGQQPQITPSGENKAAAVLSDQKIKAIYDAYVTAKQRCGEDTSKLSLDSVGDTLRKQVPQLMKDHKAKSVEFKVVIKDGKAILRAVPKE